jgi:HAMP domain-containing protein
VFVLSSDGLVLHGLPALEGRKLELQAVARATPAQAVWLRERWPDGDRYITAASVTRGHGDYRGLGWKVVLRQDPGEALAEVGRMQLQIAAAGVLVGLLFAGLAWWFADRVARPLTSISDVADRLGAGERDLTIPAVTGYSEVEHLGASLRAMLSNLRRQEEDLVQARDKLDLRVRERAAELTRTRADLEATMAEREHAQRELAAEKERLDLALDAAEVAVWTYDIASDRIELSEQWSAMLGGARGITVASVGDVIALVPEAERGAVRDAMAAAASGVKDSYVVRHHVKRANGELLVTESRGRVVERDAGGLAVRLAGTVRAI